MAARDSTTGLLKILVGPGIWFVCFSSLYAIATAQCIGLITDGAPQTIASQTVVLVSVTALVWIAIFGVGCSKMDHAFVVLVTRLLAIVSLVGTLWLLLPLVTLQSC